MFEQAKQYSLLLLLSGLVILATIKINNSSTDVRNIAASNIDAAALIVLDQELSSQIISCPDYLPEVRSHQLAHATLLVENRLINPLERKAEEILTDWFPNLLLRLDLSIGPAQIKPSSIRKFGSGVRISLKKIATPCGAFDVVVERIVSITNGDLSPKGRRLFFRSHSGTHKAIIFNIIYDLLVENVYFRLRIDSRVRAGNYG